MSKKNITHLLGEWEGYRTGTIQRFAPGEKGECAEVWVELLPIKRRRMKCSGCGRLVSSQHDITQRWVRDLPILDAITRLLVWRRRVRCPSCGPKLEEISWLGKYARATQRMIESVGRLCQVASVKHVAEFFDLSWWAVKAMDKQFLTEKLGEIDLSGIEVIAMDEFAIQKGHRYATVIVEPHIKQVLWVGRGRSRESIRPFFQLLGKQGCERLKAVAMDMNGAYEAEVKANCPNAEIVYDLFHVVAKYGREVVDRVRRDEARKAEEKEDQKLIKGTRWLLLKNKDNIKRPEDQVRLEDLLAVNRNLMVVYVLKEDLKRLWQYKYPKAALRFWREWNRRAMRSGIEPLRRFTQKLRPYIPGILSHCRYQLHTSLLEGINNKIKVIKRMAYGFRDDEYFFLKIRAAFPGIPR